MSNTQYLPPMGVPQPGTPAYGGGGRTDLVGARSILDAKRMMGAGKIPSAEYPDGYLGTLNTRRSDRLGDQALNSKPMRATTRPYARGVHKGERIESSDYLWPADFNPMTGINYQAKGQKWTATGDQLTGRHLVNGGQVQMADDPDRVDALRQLRPGWS
ncbi:hypothetical protein [Streptomyces sp. NPDC004528]|uniref:hypothetical protein n=1 Tax=Streptomyces sp. NPDC004528 TaxID=3154550 RepID=UPI00339F3CEA